MEHGNIRRLKNLSWLSGSGRLVFNWYDWDMLPSWSAERSLFWTFRIFFVRPVRTATCSWCQRFSGVIFMQFHMTSIMSSMNKLLSTKLTSKLSRHAVFPDKMGLNVFPVFEFCGTEMTFEFRLEVHWLDMFFWGKVYWSKSFRRIRTTAPPFSSPLLLYFSLPDAVWRDEQAHTRTWKIHHKFHIHWHFHHRDEHDASEERVHFDIERRGCKLDTEKKIEHAEF